MTYRVFTSISNCSTEWDDFLPQNHHLSSVHLETIERCEIQDISFRYVIISNDHEEIVAIAYFQWLRFLKRHYNYPLAKNFILQKIENTFMKAGFGILACGNMLRVDAPGLYFDSAKTTDSAVFSQLEEFFKTLAPYPHAILIKDWADHLDIHWVKQFNFQPWSADLTMKLDLPPSWKSFDDYLKALRHRYAQRARKARRQLIPIVRRELSLEEIESSANQLLELYLNIVKRQAIRMVIVNEKYFIEMKRTYQDHFRLFGYFKENKLVAFSTNILDEKLWELHYIGFDYNYNEPHWLYFNIMFDAIADAIQGGKTELELGRTAREAKSVLGAYPAYFRNYIKVRGVIPRVAIKFLQKDFTQSAGANWEAKKPFRS